MKQLEVNLRLCKGCGICIALCPKQVLEADIDGKARAGQIENCIGCKLCELRCPDFAIKLEG